MKREPVPMKKRLLFLLFALIFAVICGACAYALMSLFISDSPSTGETVVPEETVKAEPISFDELYYAYKENELVADEKYQHNRYQITAKINGMTNDGLFNLTGGAMVTMETVVDNTIVFFYAEFEKEQEEALKRVKVGDTVTFEGKCLSAGSWSECELVLE